MGGMRNAYKILIGNPEGEKPPGRSRSRQRDIRMDLREIGWGDVDWTHLAQDRDQWRAVMNTVMNLRVT
jgi:hypothetical protein